MFVHVGADLISSLLDGCACMSAVNGMRQQWEKKSSGGEVGGGRARWRGGGGGGSLK
jgi:hypothetical protein